MDKTTVYLKKVLALLLIFVTGLFLNDFLDYYYIIPFCFLSLSFLFSRITGEKPKYLFGLDYANNFLINKGGYWLLLKWVLILFGLLYDLAAMTLDGVFHSYMLFIDTILLIKIILYRIAYAILWFLKLFSPPIILIFKTFFHYLIKWPWWIYKLVFLNTGVSINRNFLFVSFRGSFFSLFIFFIFSGTAIILDIQALIFLGIVLATLPLAWASGVISCIRENNLSEETFEKTRICFNSGTDTLRVFILYLSYVLIITLLEISFNLPGWIPAVGYSLLGISLNINTLLTIVLLFLCVILLFANMMLPAHIIKTNNINANFNESISFLGVIGRKFLRFLVSLIPASFFSVILMIIPAIVISIAIFLTISLRNNILDTRIEILEEKMLLSNKDAHSQIKKNIKLLHFYKHFPKNILNEFAGIKELSSRSEKLNNELIRIQGTIINMQKEFTYLDDSLKNRAGILHSSPSFSGSSPEIPEIETLIENNKKKYDLWKETQTNLISEIETEISFSRNLLFQLPLVFLLTAIWASLFLGIVFSVLISYLSNVFYELYSFREDNKTSFFMQTVKELNNKDNNQPLLGFTLLGLCAILILFLLSVTSWF